MHTLTVTNIKCHGCENTIQDALSWAGATNIHINREEQTISFEWDKTRIIQTLEKIGYPEKDSIAAKNILTTAKSYISCMIGRARW